MEHLHSLKRVYKVKATVPVVDSLKLVYKVMRSYFHYIGYQPLYTWYTYYSVVTKLGALRQMNFKNNKTMVNQQLGLIAGQQHKYLGIRNRSNERSIYSKPKTFDIWFMEGIAYYESRGYKFQWLNLTTLKVTLPNGRTGKRTIEDFEDEYENEYRKSFPSCN